MKNQIEIRSKVYWYLNHFSATKKQNKRKKKKKKIEKKRSCRKIWKGFREKTDSGFEDLNLYQCTTFQNKKRRKKGFETYVALETVRSQEKTNNHTVLVIMVIIQKFIIYPLKWINSWLNSISFFACFCHFFTRQHDLFRVNNANVRRRREWNMF